MPAADKKSQMTLKQLCTVFAPSQQMLPLTSRAENGCALHDLYFMQRLPANRTGLTGAAVNFHFFAVTARLPVQVGIIPLPVTERCPLVAHTGADNAANRLPKRLLFAAIQ
jgi:hypothetical protein